MSQIMKEFNQFYQATHQLIRMSEHIEDTATDLLRQGYPRTKEEASSLYLFPIPSCEDALKLSADLVLIDAYPGYEEIRRLSIELLSRVVVVLQSFEDTKELFAMYGMSADILQFNQLMGITATALGNMQYTLAELRTIYSEKSWKLFDSITRFIPEVENTGEVGKWVFDTEPAVPGKPTPAPYVHYEELPFKLLDAVYEFVKEHPAYDLPDGYMFILQENGIAWSDAGMRDADVTTLDDECILALIIGVACAERFSDGTIERFFHNGTMLRWLNRLDALDYGLQTDCGN